ncbi:conserved hypothetical protein [Microsporum canis CBS 113480]|uniref:Uncharacterized protein n=1 Tax=Arthroderma otae (strain ATCC MYA-4605 / CBS 113480) TaxID=554155 RepID=C5FGK2_ARTOC|nr:conserved hypothetical protein [Microsporum canis CBS 113480]EEQ29887.1 conserved hypothetical protein [Microsporum canis CBS 113480]
MSFFSMLSSNTFNVLCNIHDHSELMSSHEHGRLATTNLHHANYYKSRDKEGFCIKGSTMSAMLLTGGGHAIFSCRIYQAAVLARTRRHVQHHIPAADGCPVLVAAYHDAAKLVKRIQSTAATTTTDTTTTTTSAASTAEESNTALADLGDSLMLGPPIVQGQYEENLMRLGNAYANGDQNAREALKDVVINLQLTLLATLRMALLDNLDLDFDALQRASDESRVNALVCLFQLGQRLSLGSPSIHPKMPPSNRQTVVLGDPGGGSSNSHINGKNNSQFAIPVDAKMAPPIPPMSPSRVASNSASSGDRVSRDSSYMHHRPPSSVNPVSPPLNPQQPGHNPAAVTPI